MSFPDHAHRAWGEELVLAYTLSLSLTTMVVSPKTGRELHGSRGRKGPKFLGVLVHRLAADNDDP